MAISSTIQALVLLLRESRNDLAIHLQDMRAYMISTSRIKIEIETYQVVLATVKEN